MSTVKIIVFEATQPNQCYEMNKFLAKEPEIISIHTSAAACETSIRNYITIVYRDYEQT